MTATSPLGLWEVTPTLDQKDFLKSTTVLFFLGTHQAVTASVFAYINLILEMATFCAPAESRP